MKSPKKPKNKNTIKYWSYSSLLLFVVGFIFAIIGYSLQTNVAQGFIVMLIFGFVLCVISFLILFAIHIVKRVILVEENALKEHREINDVDNQILSNSNSTDDHLDNVEINNSSSE